MSKTKRICILADIPQWYDSYDYILNGYRMNYSIFELFGSITEIHNEISNVWTELIPSILYAFLLIYSIFYNESFYFNQPLQLTKYLIIILFPITPIRMLISTYVHLTHCYNKTYSKIAWICDYQWIVLSCMVNGLISWHLVFYCYNINVTYAYFIGAIPYYILLLITVTIASSNLLLREIALSTMAGIFGHIGVFYHIYAVYNNDTTHIHLLPDLFTYLWFCSTFCLAIAQFIRTSQYPEKWYILPKILKSLDYKNEIDFTKQCNCHSNRNKMIRKACLQQMKYEKECEYNIYKLWYIYILPSHSVWHIFINMAHFGYFVSWYIALSNISKNSNHCKLVS
eukprot:265678_1